VNTPTILVVDDCPDNFDIIETLLADRDYQLYYADSGASAFTLLESFTPDAILLDVMMPEIDGIQVCRQIKARPGLSSIPIVMVTALNSKEDLAHCLQSGADDFISKPVNKVELQARLQSMLRLKWQYDQIHSLSQVQKNTISLLETSLDKLRKSLAASLPHELNTPLNGILGGLNLLLFDLEEMPPEEVRELLEISQSAAFRLEAIVQRLLLYLQLELDGAIPKSLTGQTSNLSAIVDTVLTNQTNGSARAADLDVAIDNVRIALPKQHCQALIGELVDNALKFSSPGMPIEISSEVTDSSCFVSIGNQGRMMTSEQVREIDAFVQFERASYEQQGLGLGLRIVQNIAKAIGGTFSVESVPPDRTIVQLRLPIAPSEEAVPQDAIATR